MVVGLEFTPRGVKQEPGFCGRNSYICIKNSVGRLTGTVVSHDANNNVRYAPIIQGSVNKKLAMGGGRGRNRELNVCKVNWRVVTGIKERPSCMVFVVTFFVKGVDSFDKVVTGCGFSDSQDDIWGIFVNPGIWS